MDILRTPDNRFVDLPDYPFAPNYLDLPNAKLRMHYVDEGRADANPILCLHGEPSWSYLYRHMIPVFATSGHRVIAPDLIGFGKSDKPTERSDYTYASHVAWMTEALETLDLRNITLVCQDWGGLIGLRLLAAMPERFARLVVANTALPTGDQPMGEAFAAWRAFSQTMEPFRAGRIIYGGTVSKLTGAEQAAYDAPFPGERYMSGAREFPMLVPDSPDNPASDANRAAWGVLRGLDIPVLTAFGAQDKIMIGVERVFQKLMPGAVGQAHHIYEDAGHFLQEDIGPDLARRVNAFIAAT